MLNLVHLHEQLEFTRDLIKGDYIEFKTCGSSAT